SSHERASIASDIPTLDECGVTGYDMTNWVGIAGPYGMAEAMTHRLSEAVTAAVRSAPVSAAMREQGIIPSGGTSQEFAAFIWGETEKWRPVVTQLRKPTA
ncbi:MAG TPA: tripartite tricarboxylate transporter substrate-binding protein, partial [Burkholderiales bacterium]|nr:tripartite tricarboxylate transporter substrate-binding protein [Burkholderiales bacterium]